MKQAYLDCFLRYISFDTQTGSSETVPGTFKQVGGERVVVEIARLAEEKSQG